MNKRFAIFTMAVALMKAGQPSFSPCYRKKDTSLKEQHGRQLFTMQDGMKILALSKESAEAQWRKLIEKREKKSRKSFIKEIESGNVEFKPQSETPELDFNMDI